MKTPVNPSKGYSCAMSVGKQLIMGIFFSALTLSAEAETAWICEEWKDASTHYYLYNQGAEKFLNDDNQLTATPKVYWTISSVSSGQIKSSNEKYINVWSTKNGRYYTSHANSSNGLAVTLSAIENQKTYYQIGNKIKVTENYINKEQTRFILAEGDDGTQIGVSNTNKVSGDKYAHAHWTLVSEQQYNSTLPYYFKATAITSTGGTAEVSVDNNTWSGIQTISLKDPKAPSLTANSLSTTFYFKAEVTAGYAFEGWQDEKGDIVSRNLEYEYTLTSSSHNSSKPDSTALKAIFSKKPIFAQNFESTNLTVGQSFSQAFIFRNTSSNTPSDKTSDDFYFTLTQSVNTTNLEGSLHPDRVITYDPATNTLTAENKGTATLTFTQNATTNCERGERIYTITVDKNRPNFKWNEAGVDLYTTTCYGDIFQSDNSDMLWSVKDPQPDAAIVQDFAQGSSKATGTLTTGSKAGSTEITISQEENYKWHPQTETYIITVAERPISSNRVLCDGPKVIKEPFLGMGGEYDYYRIPALGVDQNGKMYAMFDYRHKENSDIGNGHAIDICSKEGQYNSVNNFTWNFTKKNHLVGKDNYGYGDPAIVVDADNNEVLVLCVCGGNKYKNGPQEQGAIWCKNDKWDENITPLTNQIKKLGEEASNWNTNGMFFASGRILQSRIVKKGTYYRLYAALLSSGYGNAVVYSDDFGRTWNVLGDAKTSCCPDPKGNEAKVEELSDGTIVLSSRAQRKRWFNVFTFTNLDAATGSWGTPAQPDRIMYGDGSPVNGDFYRLRVFHNGTPAEILLQFHTNENSARENLTCFWRDITGQTAATFNTADNWNVGLQIVNGQSCYSSMAIMPDGYIGLLWEDGTNNSTKEQYDIYFNTFTVSQLLKDNSYSPKVQLLYKFFIGNYQGQISGKDIYVYNVSQEDLPDVKSTQPTINPTGKDIRIETTSYTQNGDEYKATLTLQYGIYREKYNLHIVPIKTGTIGSGNGTTNEADGTFIWRKDAFNSKWSDPNNWYVCYNGQTFTSNAVPMQSNNVIIPADASTYPNIVTSNCYCNCIYLEAGARLGGQFLLNYNKAFVDVKVPANRYVRITPPLRDTYAGDFFTAEQGGEWTNFTPAMLSKVVEGTLDEGGKNRTTHATYQSLYASTFQTLDPYGGITTHSVQSKWEAPYNSMEYKYEEGQGFDIWMDYDNDTDSATFHFPSGETQYDYFSEKEGKIVSQTAAIVRDEHQYRLAFDNTNTNRGYANFVFSRNAGATEPAFVIGNIGQAYLSIFNFLKTNVENMTTTPFLYKHTPIARDNRHGKQTIYFYLSSEGGKLFKADPQAVQIDPNGVITLPSGTEVDKKATEAMIAPNEAFMIMAGESKITSAEPHLIGNFNGEYRYYGVPFQKVNGTKIFKDGMAGGKPDELIREFVFSIAADPNDIYRVRIGNFVGRGYVWGTINPQKKTLTIQAGTPVTYVDNSSWVNGGRILRIYGCDDDKLAFTDWFTYKKGQYPTYEAQTKRVTNAHSDIVFDYTVDVVNGIAKFTLRRPFVICSEEFSLNNNKPTYRKDQGGLNSNTGGYNTTPMGKEANQEEECEAFFVYDQLSGSKTFIEHDEPFIYPDIEGKYKADVSSVLGTPTPQGVAIGTYQTITMERILGNYDHVLIDGLYPNCTNTPIVGKITRSSEGKYYLTIPEAQLVNEKEPGNAAANYFFYIKGRNDTIKMVWDNDAKTWTQPDKQLQISHLNANPSSSSDGFIIGNGTIGVLHQTEHIEHDDNILLSSQNDRLQVSFTPQMFAANVSELQITGASLHAPARVDNNPVVCIVANDGTYQTSTLIVVDENADNEFRKREDAPLFDIHKSAFCLGTIAGTQIVGINSIAELDNLPLYVSASATIVCNNIEAFGEEVELYDAINDIATTISNNHPLQLYIADGEQAGKYYLRRASATEDTPSNDNSCTEVRTVVYSPARATIMVNSSQTVDEVQVYNMAGQLVASAQNVQRQQFTGLQQGIYIVEITHANNTQQAKVTVY